MKIKFAVVDCLRNDNEVDRFDTYEEAEEEIIRRCDDDGVMCDKEYKIEKRWCSD